MTRKKPNLDLERWTIRLCALAFISGIYLTATNNEKDKNDIKRAIATSTCAVLGGIGMGMANNRFLNRHNERN